MTGIIQTKPNQSILDVILQGRGTLEGGMEMMAANDRSISDRPVIGETIRIGNDPFISDPGALRYLQEKGIVIGTLGGVVSSPLSVNIVLKPVMQVVPAATSPPGVIGEYEFDYVAASGFVNAYPIQHAPYPVAESTLWFLSDDRYIAGDIPFPTVCPDQFMDDEHLAYSIPWTTGQGFMMAWTDLSAVSKTVTFVDVKGNEAYFAPLVVFDNASQNVVDFIAGDLQVELVSTTFNAATIRLTRSQSFVAHINFVNQSLVWLNDAAGGTPDPSDPSNPDKTMLTLSRGTYTFGMATLCLNGGNTYPPAAFTMVVEII